MIQSEQSDILHNTYPVTYTQVRIQRGTGGPDPLKNHKAT